MHGHKLKKEPDSPDKRRLNLNRMDVLERFREKYQEVQFSKGKGIKMQDAQVLITFVHKLLPCWKFIVILPVNVKN
jgi:hypothetical protein